MCVSQTRFIFFLIKTLVVIFSVIFRCFCLNYKTCFHILIFFISRFDLIVTKNEIKSRDDENEKKFVKNSKSFDFETFFESFDLLFFFLFETATNAKVENADADVDELEKNSENSKVNEENSKINGEDSKVDEENSKVSEKNSKTDEGTNTNGEELRIIIIDTERKVIITFTKTKNKNILLALLRNLIVFSTVFVAITTFRFVLSCFF